VKSPRIPSRSVSSARTEPSFGEGYIDRWCGMATATRDASSPSSRITLRTYTQAVRFGESEQRFTLAQKAAHLAIWDRDLSTNLISISGEYNQIYGLAADHPALAYEDWLRLIHREDRQRVRERNRNTATRTNIWDEEFRVAWPDGSVHWLLGKGTVFRDDAGQPVRMAGVNVISRSASAPRSRSLLAPN